MPYKKIELAAGIRGKKVTANAFIVNEFFAVHKSVNREGEWTLTHLPTGQLCKDFVTRKAALAAAKKLSDMNVGVELSAFDKISRERKREIWDIMTRINDTAYFASIGL